MAEVRLSPNSDILGLMWAPRVASQSREEFEQAVAAEGIEDFRIRSEADAAAGAAAARAAMWAGRPTRTRIPAAAAAGARAERQTGAGAKAPAPRVYLKPPNAPGQRAFSRCAASVFLEIRQYSCEKMSFSA